MGFSDCMSQNILLPLGTEDVIEWVTCPVLPLLRNNIKVIGNVRVTFSLKVVRLKLPPARHTLKRCDVAVNDKPGKGDSVEIAVFRTENS